MTRRERERGLPGGLRVNLGFASLPVPEKPTDSAAALRWWMASASDPWFDIEPLPRIRAPCWLPYLQVSSLTLEDARNGVNQLGGRVQAPTIRAIEQIRDLIESGRLVFLWWTTRNRVDAILLEAPARLPLPQHKLVARSDYSWWAKCRACGGRRFAPVLINGVPHAACWNCLPPREYGMLGAKPDPQRLVFTLGDALPLSPDPAAPPPQKNPKRQRARAWCDRMIGHATSSEKESHDGSPSQAQDAQGAQNEADGAQLKALSVSTDP